MTHTIRWLQYTKARSDSDTFENCDGDKIKQTLIIFKHNSTDAWSEQIEKKLL